MFTSRSATLGDICTIYLEHVAPARALELFATAALSVKAAPTEELYWQELWRSLRGERPDLFPRVVNSRNGRVLAFLYAYQQQVAGLHPLLLAPEEDMLLREGRAALRRWSDLRWLTKPARLFAFDESCLPLRNIPGGAFLACSLDLVHGFSRHVLLNEQFVDVGQRQAAPAGFIAVLLHEQAHAAIERSYGLARRETSSRYSTHPLAVALEEAAASLFEAAVHYYLHVGAEPDRRCIAYNAHLYPNARGIRQLLALVEGDAPSEILRAAASLAARAFGADDDRESCAALNSLTGKQRTPAQWRRALTA